MSAIVRSTEYNDAAFKSSRNYECVTTRCRAEAIINRTEKCEYHSRVRALIQVLIVILDNAHHACVHHDAALSYLEGAYDAASAAADGDYECVDEDTIVVVECDHKANHVAACAAYDAYVVADDSVYDAHYKLWHAIKDIKFAIQLYKSMLPGTTEFEL